MASTAKIYIRSDQLKCQFCNSPSVSPQTFFELIVHYEDKHQFKVVKEAKGIEGGIIEVAWLERAE